MIKVDHHVAIRRSPTEVYDYVTDVERIPEWQHVAGVRKVTKHDAEPLQVGSRFTMEREARGNVATIDSTVTALEPGRRFDFHTVDDDGFVGDFSTTLAGGEGSTDLHWAVRMEAGQAGIGCSSRSSRARSEVRDRRLRGAAVEARGRRCRGGIQRPHPGRPSGTPK